MPRLNSRLTLVLSAAALAAIPGTAFAQSFDGPYAGVEGGLEVLSTDGVTIAGPFEDSETSAVIRGVAGYRTTVGAEAGPVVGVEGDIGLVTGEGDLRYGVSAIGGVQIGSSSLFYGRVGYAWLDGIQRPGGEGIDGLVLGGGFETALSGNTHLRIDYRHLGYGGYELPDNAAEFDGHEVTGGVIFAF